MIIDRIKDVFHEMIVNRIDQKLAFFVGAGISVPPPSNLPTFKKLNEEIIRLATGDLLNGDKYKTLSDIRPEVVLQILTEELGSIILQYLDILTKAVPNHNHFFLAEALKQGNWVFTTNYDNLIEKACEAKEIEVRKCYEDGDFEEFIEEYISTGKIPEGCIFKLHGYIDENKEGEKRFGPILIALRQVARGLTLPKRKVLEHFLRNFDFCFMGYSCRDDFSIYPVLLGTSSQKSIFWFKYADEEIGEITWSKKRFQSEKEREENKPPEEQRDWETVNISEFLLKREQSFELTGDSSEFVKEKFRSSVSHELIKYTYHESKKHQPNQWIKEISDFQKNLVAGRLYHYTERFDKAKEYFEKAEDAVQHKQEKAIAQRWRANAHYLSETKEDYKKALGVLKESLEIFKELSDKFEVARTKTDIANSLRRDENFPDALKYAEEAKELFESKREEFIRKDGREKYDFEYAKCLNIFGLIYYALSRKEPSNALSYLKEALKFCKNSKEMRENIGDISGVAASENAIGLIFIEYFKYASGLGKEQAIKLLNNGIDTLNEALEKGERIGDYRVCEQCCRNLMLGYLRLAELNDNEKEKKKYSQRLWNAYERGVGYMRRQSIFPQRRLLEFRFRSGESFDQMGETDKAIKVFSEVASERSRLADWHNEARALGKLLRSCEKAKRKRECKDWCFKIVSIYDGVLKDSNKLKEMRDFPDKFNNAKEILQNTKETLMKMNLVSEANVVDHILKQLTEQTEKA